MTIYFGGTTMTEEMYQAGTTEFSRPETLAILHFLQEAGPASDYPNHHKGFIDGPVVAFPFDEAIQIPWAEHFDEVISNIKAADEVTQGPTGRLMIGLAYICVVFLRLATRSVNLQPETAFRFAATRRIIGAEMRCWD